MVKVDRGVDPFVEDRPARSAVPASEKLAAIDEINRLLDSTSQDTLNTSMRLSVALHDAAGIAVAELGAAPSTTALASAALRGGPGVPRHAGGPGRPFQRAP
jgi:hypothetical protein